MLPRAALKQWGWMSRGRIDNGYSRQVQMKVFGGYILAWRFIAQDGIQCLDNFRRSFGVLLTIMYP